MTYIFVYFIGIVLHVYYYLAFTNDLMKNEKVVWRIFLWPIADIILLIKWVIKAIVYGIKTDILGRK